MAMVKSYSAKTLVGNWFEDIILEEDVMKNYMEKRENGQLLSQQLKGGSCSDQTRSVGYVTASTDGRLKFGDCIQLCNPGADPVLVQMGRITPRPPSNLVISPPLHGAGDEAPAAAGMTQEPNARNVFRIMSCDGTSDGSTVRYGEPFQLATNVDDTPYYAISESASFARAAKKSRNNEIYFTRNPGFGTQWHAEYFNPQCRLEFEGSPILVNEKVLIKHNKTNECLALEAKHAQRSLHGVEFEISGHTYLDEHKAERDVNHWVFSTRVCPGIESATEPSAPVTS